MIGDRRTNLILVAQSLAGFTVPLVADRVPVELIVLLNAMVPKAGESAGKWWEHTGHEAARAEHDAHEHLKAIHDGHLVALSRPDELAERLEDLSRDQ